MFTLKLFRREGASLRTRVVSVDHVQTMSIGFAMIEVWAFHSRVPGENVNYDIYYIGEKETEKDMDWLSPQNHWGWGLLENVKGNTTEHYRPASYG